MGRRLVLALILVLPEVAACTAVPDDAPGRAAGVAPEFLRIPAGTFDMGCVPGDYACSADERPRHEVTISRDFWMMRTEVTVGAYKKFAAATGRTLPEPPVFNERWTNESHPIVMVAWSDADAYCRSMGGRLPTEAEWEYAARGGHAGWKYVWGNEAVPRVNGQRHANVADESGKKSELIQPEWAKQAGWFHGYDDGYTYTSPPGAFAPNHFGLHDMAGNVSEWCLDWYHGEYYLVSPSADPRGPAEPPGPEFPGGPGELRATRGGSFMFLPPADLRVSQRTSSFPEGDAATGFRCVRDTSGP